MSRESQNTVYVLRKLTESEWSQIVEDNCRVYTVDTNHLPTKSHSQDVRNVELQDFYQDLNSKLFDSINTFSDNNGLVSKLNFDQDFSSWYYLRFLLFTRTKPILIEYFLIEEISKLHSDQPTLVFTEYKHVRYASKIPEKKNNATSQKEVFKKIFKKRLKQKQAKIRSGNPLLLLNKSEFTSMVDANTGQPILAHPLFSNFLAHTENNILAEMYPFSKNSDMTNLLDDGYIQRMKNEVVFEKYLFETALRFWLWPSIYKRRKQINSKLEEIVAASSTDTHENIIAKSLKSTKGLLLFAYLRTVSASRIFKKHSIPYLLVTDEYNIKSMSVMLAAKRNNVPVVAMQHGVISNIHFGYVYRDKDLDKNIIPDKYLMWGGKWLEQFKDATPKLAEKSEVIGMLRTDNCVQLNQNAKVEWCFEKHASAKKVFLFATQPPAYIPKILTEDFIRLAKERHDDLFLIKPHPREKDLKWYYDLIERYQVSNVVVSKDDLYYLIAISDAVLVNYSTVGIEALYFKKPLIVFDYQKQDLAGFNKQGIASMASSYDELVSLLNNVDSLKLKAVDDYIRDYAYLIDGKRSVALENIRIN